jgi:polyisoprenoid-binding protein YceI
MFLYEKGFNLSGTTNEVSMRKSCTFDRMKVVTFCILLLMAFWSSPTVFGQNLYESKGSVVSFTSEAPLENISASTTSLKGLLNTISNSFAFTIEVGTFKGFNSDLQREHFNENYLESDVFPKASFEGKLIDKFNPDVSSQKVRAKGSLAIHGIKQERIIDISIEKKGESYIISTSFLVPLKDHGIRIPKIVNQKISDNISVAVKSEMVRKK